MKVGLVAALCAVALASCTVGPDYARPENAAPARFGEKAPAADGGIAFTADAPDQAWWSNLGDPLLAELVGRAAANNQQLAAAKARVREARALHTVSDASTDPRIDLFAVAWELDIFGGGRRSVEAAGARYDAAVESARDVLLLVAAEVARNYVELRADQRRMGLAESTIELQKRFAERTRNKLSSGLALEYDVVGADAQLKASQADIPRLRARIAAAAHRIGVLTGDQPTALVDRLTASRPLPAAPDIVPVGLPSDLMKRRPDIRRTERALHAATAEIGVATADLFPRFSLTGTVGLRGSRFSDLFMADSVVWRIGAGILMPLFNRERLYGQVAAANARADGALAEHRQTVLQALEEVESNLVRYAQGQIRRRELESAVRDSRRALQLARDLYDRGLKDIVHVLTAQRALTENTEALIATEAAAMQDLVALYKALGGGWSQIDVMT